jgi:hypothetical protein
VLVNDMWRSRYGRTLAIALVPTTSYLLVLFAVAVFERPPLLGWIGLAVVAAGSLSIAGLAAYFWPRSRVNVDRFHPHPSGTFRLLVVVDADIAADELAGAVAARVGAREAEVRVVAPSDGSAIAKRRLSEALPALGGPTVAVEGKLGGRDPLEATGDELVTFPADEILFVGRPPGSRHVFDRDFERLARDLYGVHCSTLEAA